MRLWQTKSFAIITYTTVPGDCIDRVTSQNGDRVLFERLATPRPLPKVTLKGKYSHSSHSSRRSHISRMTLRASGNIVLPEKADQERETIRNTSVKEEPTDTSAKAIERIKIGSNTVCIREDFAKEKMVFSKKKKTFKPFSTGHIELIELKKTTIQCPSCLHHVFEGTFLCTFVSY